MPYFFENPKHRIRLPKNKDRRIRLTNNDRAKIMQLYNKGYSIRAISREYKGICSRRLIQFVLFPERYEHALRLRYAKNDYYNYLQRGERHNKYMRNHRRYKYKVLKEGK